MWMFEEIRPGKSKKRFKGNSIANRKVPHGMQVKCLILIAWIGYNGFCDP